jgi:hypothetical protein
MAKKQEPPSAWILPHETLLEQLNELAKNPAVQLWEKLRSLEAAEPPPPHADSGRKT